MQKPFLFINRHLQDVAELLRPRPVLVGFFCLFFHTIMLYASVSFNINYLINNLTYFISVVNSTSLNFEGRVILGTYQQNIVLLILQVVMTFSCLLMMSMPLWKNLKGKHFAYCWYLLLIIIVPFYNAALLILSYAQTEWLMTFLAFSLLLLLLVDWICFLLINFFGIGLAALIMWPIFKFYVPGSVGLELHDFTRGIIYLQRGFAFTLPFLMAMGIGLVFSRNLSQAYENKLLKDQLNAMQIVAVSVAHELGTPILTIDAAVKILKKSLPEIKNQALLSSNLYSGKYELSDKFYSNLESAIARAEKEICSIYTVIKMLLFKLSPVNMDKKCFTVCCIADIVNEAVIRYPYKKTSQKQLVNVNISNNFQFLGLETFMVHVIFNLLKNALYQIDAYKQGNVNIWTDETPQMNCLHFKDTGPGIPKDELPNIFNQFYSKTTGGTGVGLTFCKMVLTFFDGKIECYSEPYQFTHFILSLPKLTLTQIEQFI